jgi:hypothetical protein
MSLFLNRKNNLADVEDIYESRRNLGFGTLANYNSNNVTITGGSIKIDSLTIKSDQAGVNKFLVCKSNDGRVDFTAIEFGDWVRSNDPNDIRLSEFNNDLLFVDRSSICNIAFTGDYNDLTNTPTNLSHLSFTNDLIFLEKTLYNIDREQAISNLGLGTLALRNSEDYIIFNNLTINCNLKFEEVHITNNPKYLHIGDNGVTYWNSLSKASDTQYGVVQLQDNYMSSNEGTAPSSKAISDLYISFSNILDGIGNVALDANISEAITHNGIMRRQNNLSEITNVDQAQINLGFDNRMRNLINTLNMTDTFRIPRLTVTSNFIFEDLDKTVTGVDIGNETYLSVNDQGQVFPKKIQLATDNTAGFVYIKDYYPDPVNNVDNSTVLSVRAIDEFVNTIYYTKYAELSNMIEPEIRRMYAEYMRVDDNIRVHNPSIARSHLQLHEIAHTGDYYQLENAPSNLSQFSNEFTQFLSAKSNLAELHDIDIARLNLGLGSVSTYDSNNVIILGGNGVFTNLTINSQVQYNYNGTNFQNMFLQSINPNGDCRWSKLPEGTSYQKGIVKIENNYQKYDDKKASSASALFKVYYKLLGEIDGINRDIRDINNFLNI